MPALADETFSVRWNPVGARKALSGGGQSPIRDSDAWKLKCRTAVAQPAKNAVHPAKMSYSGSTRSRANSRDGEENCRRSGGLGGWRCGTSCPTGLSRARPAQLNRIESTKVAQPNHRLRKEGFDSAFDSQAHTSCSRKLAATESRTCGWSIGATAGLCCSVERQDTEALAHGDRAFDTIISFRLFHHFPNPDIRRRAVRRKLQAALGGKKSSKHSTPLSEVRGDFEDAGFDLVKDFAEMPVIHRLHLAVFKRRP